MCCWLPRARSPSSSKSSYSRFEVLLVFTTCSGYYFRQTRRASPVFPGGPELGIHLQRCRLALPLVVGLSPPPPPVSCSPPPRGVLFAGSYLKVDKQLLLHVKLPACFRMNCFNRLLMVNTPKPLSLPPERTNPRMVSSFQQQSSFSGSVFRGLCERFVPSPAPERLSIFFLVRTPFRHPKKFFLHCNIHTPSFSRTRFRWLAYLPSSCRFS